MTELHPLPEELAHLPPDRLLGGKHLVVRHIDTGGFGAVCEAYNEEWKQPLAAKILLGSEPHDIQRFRQEVQVIAALDHPNIIRILSSNTKGSPVYLIMPLLRGETLEQNIQTHGPLEPQRALKLMRAALGAMDHMHQRDFVHRDLKPSNLFIVEPATPKESLVILDLGLAFNFQCADPFDDGARSPPGTPNYMAPEFIRDGHSQPAMDVYALGLTLYEMLTGERLVEGQRARAFITHTSGVIPSLPARWRQDPLGAILERSLALRPDKRFENAGEFLKAIDALSAEQAPEVSPEPPAERPPKPPTIIEHLAVTPSPAALEEHGEKPRWRPLARALMAAVVATVVGGFAYCNSLSTIQVEVIPNGTGCLLSVETQEARSACGGRQAELRVEGQGFGSPMMRFGFRRPFWMSLACDGVETYTGRGSCTTQPHTDTLKRK